MAKTNRSAQGKAAAPAAAAPTGDAANQAKADEAAAAAAAAQAKADEEAAAARSSQPEVEFSGYAEEIDFAGKTIAVRAEGNQARRRAGFAFGREPIELAADDLSEDQLGQILADPQLIVSIV